MARRDFIISYFADSPLLRKALAKLDQQPVVFQPQIAGRKYKDFVTSHGNSVLSLWNMAPKNAGDTLGRVAVLGFSEGGTGVRSTLETKDASAIDAAIVADGIHTGKTLGVLEMGLLGAYVAFGRLAVSDVPSKNPDTKLMIVTHSSIGAASLPPGMASTTETAEVIYNDSSKAATAVETPMCGWPCPAALTIDALSQVHWPSAELPLGTKLPAATITDAGWTTVRPSGPETGFLKPATFSWSGFDDGWTIRRIVNNLHVFGWSYPTPNKTKDPTGNRDHVFQAQMVLPTVVEKILVPRWNAKCGVPLTGFGEETVLCRLDGKGYFDQEAKPLDVPTLPIPKLPIGCPTPPPGKTIIGRPGDPCWTGEARPTDLQFLNWLFALAGGVGGYYGMRWFLRQERRKT